MAILKVGDYLPTYLHNRLEFSAPGFTAWARYLTIRSNSSYHIKDVKEDAGLYYINAGPVDPLDTFILRIKDVDSIIKEHEGRKPRFKNFITKIFNFK